MLGELVRASSLLTAATLIAGALGYVFQVLMARLLGSSYAAFGALNALSMLLMSPLGAIAILLVRRVAAEAAHGAVGRVRQLYQRSLAGVGVAAAVGAVFTWAFLPEIQSYLRAQNAVSIWLLWTLTMVSAVAAINVAFLQGLQRFGWCACVASASVFLKILASVPFVATFGWGLNGAVAGMCVSAMIAALISGVVMGKHLRRGPAEAGSSATDLFPMGSIFPVVVASVALSVMTQLDMVLVNHYFDEYSATHYAAASILGKIVLYLPGGIVGALLPLVSQRHARRESGVEELKQALLMTGAVCGAAAVFFAVAGRSIMQILYGPDYADAGVLLAVYGFAVLPITIIIVVENFMMATGRTLFTWLFLIICPLQILAIHVWHPSLVAVIGVLGLCNGLMMAAGLAVVWSLRRKPVELQETLGKSFDTVR